MEKKIEFLPEQKKAIDLRGKNILVSASAGAGKTAVLTERIVSILSDTAKSIDIDNLVVVTFTRAAAAQMRTRIEGKLKEKIADCENEQLKKHLKKQITMLPHANITTIDSFCMNILRNYFYMINLDPSFKMMEENDNKLMMKDVLHELLCEKYEEKTPQFIDLVERIAPGKTDMPLVNTIFRLYRFAISHAWPTEWLDDCRKIYNVTEKEDIDKLSIIKDSGVLLSAKTIISQEICRMEKAVLLVSPMAGEKQTPEMDAYTVFLSNEYEALKQLMDCQTYSQYKKALNKLTFERFPSKKVINDELFRKEEAKKIRETTKKNIKKLITDYFSFETEEIAVEFEILKPAINELIDITQEFARRFDEKKREENVIDFNDVEHFALDILYETDENGNHIPSHAARELMDKYEYILIDEYQDSNDVQEAILTAFSKEQKGIKNMFMVGDVKQSIYQFRLAKPEIFEAKRMSYSENEQESEDVRIVLGRNFRSSRTILEGVNYLFKNIMKSEIGGVEYDESHCFKFGDDKPVTDETADPIEVIYVTTGDNDITTDSDLSDYSKRELEAMAVAKRIKALTDPETGYKIFDKDINDYRIVSYSDIVILMRSMKGWAEEFVEVLNKKGIPATAEEKKGYFSAYEIQIVLSFLKIIDNPRQDIPLIAVMKSLFGGFTDEELSIIRLAGEGDMYSALVEYANRKSDDTLTKVKAVEFLDMLGGFRRKAPYYKVHEIIGQILESKDFYLNMEAMPGGDRRGGNLRMLTKKAIEYERSEKKSIFEFLSSISEMIDSDIDFGEAGMEASPEGNVRIMSIHKSKGLEFPVVIAAGMGKCFNLTDTKNVVDIHPELGIGADIVDYNTRVKKKTFIKKTVDYKIRDDIFGEELRVLYVAMTRPQNKLIITGYIKNAEKYLEDSGEKGFDYNDMKSPRASYLSWITPFVILNPTLFYVGIISADEIIVNESLEDVKNEEKKLNLSAMLKESDFSEIQGIIEENREYHYPYMEETAFPIKVSVSDIKHKNAMEEDEEATKAAWVQTEKPEYIPSFVKGEEEEEKVIGAARGTIYHGLMEHIDLSLKPQKETITSFIEELMRKGVLPENTISDRIINTYKIRQFLISKVAARMQAAEGKGKLYREQPFVMGLPASMIYPETDSEETIIVQGIIDVFFEEEDGIVLLDYKTDRLNEGEEETLINRYRSQMECYKMAIEKTSSKKVKEIILYSFSLDKEILL